MKKFLALVLALVMTMSLVTVGASAKTDFTDDAKITNEEAVEVLNAMGVLTGYADGSFRPQGVLTRGAGAKIIAYLMLGQAKADKLAATYTVFEDVTDTVGLAAYIEWAAANGIVDGYGDGTFGPYNQLTEYAFGKMLLTALGYDSAKEGYTGAGWQKAVYRDAVAAGIYDGTETWGACDRETAARFALGALLASQVAYGTAIDFGSYGWSEKWWIDNDVTILNGRVYGPELWYEYEGLYYYDYEQDIFGRPGHAWEYKTTFSKFYQDAPVAEYTTAVSVCDVLVDCGYAKTSKASADVCYYVDGIHDFKDLCGVYSHADCDDTFGGQGTLTQVFDMGGGDFIVTEIHTFLADVDSAKDNTHKKTGTSVIDVWYATASEKADNLVAEDVTVEANIGYTKGDYILVNVGNPEGWDPADTTVYAAAADRAEAALVIVGEPTVIAEAKFTGVAKDQSEATVAGKREKVAYMYGLSEVTELDYANKNTVANFFVDQYGNLIGDVDLGPDAFTYGVLADLVWVNDGGVKGDRYAEVLYYAADASEEVFTMKKYDTLTPADADDVVPETAEATVSQKAAANNVYYSEAEFLGVVRNYGDGVVVGVDDTNGAVYAENVNFEKNNPNVADLGKVDTDTQFLVKTLEAGKAVYTAYTGIDTLPSIKLADAVAVYETAKTAEFVYIDATNAIFDGSSVYAVVLDTEWVYADVTSGTYEYNVWVNGEEVTVIATTANLGADAAALFASEALYLLSMNADGKIIAVDKQNNADGWARKYAASDVTDTDTVVVLSDGKAVNIATAKIYAVEVDETVDPLTDASWDDAFRVTAAEMTDILEGYKVFYKLAAGSDYVVDTMFVFVPVEE